MPGDRMKKRLCIAISLAFFSVLLFSETASEKFWDSMKVKDYDEAERCLAEWKKAKPKDAELYVAYFNYYIAKATAEQMRLETTPPDSGEYIEAKNENGDTIYLYSTSTYDDVFSEKAFAAIDKGLSYHPKRLDMYFGKAHFYYMREEYSEQKELLKRVFALHKKYGGKWLWSNNTPIEKTPVDFEETVHNYIADWLGTENPTAIECAKEIALLFVKYFPNNPVAYNDAGLSYSYSDDLASAKKYYKAGYERDESDMILLANLAYVCKNLGETDEAERYYLLMAESDDTQYADFAKRQLENLR